mmetsp:Transcript_27653/g.39547  ORF Transcript_27653/g.39547 Transcript_27653/m.39547 type:complete len:88 (+) Transcript_27653:274-537(+)
MISRTILLLLAMVFAIADARIRFSRNVVEQGSPSEEEIAGASPEQKTKPYWDAGKDRVLTDRYFGHQGGSYNHGSRRHGTGKHLFNW